jgi:hypothetical protein
MPMTRDLAVSPSVPWLYRAGSRLHLVSRGRISSGR